ncbi:MAG: T9SS type A sorting domain-containing protein [Bacteroidia bacterium]
MKKILLTNILFANFILSTINFSIAQQTASDDFERHLLGNNWTVYFGGNDVGIVDSSDLGFPNNNGYFGLLGWTAYAFQADQYSEIIISPDKIDSMLCQAFVRRRSSDFARYGFHWNNANNEWEIKYDGVSTAQTRILASVIAPAPLGGDTIRTEITGMTISGYRNGALMLTATDTAFTNSNPITTTGTPGIAYRWTTTFTPVFPAPVIEQWNGGDLSQTTVKHFEKDFSFAAFPNPASTRLNIYAQNFLDAELFSVDGRKILKTSQKVCNVSHLQNGVYFLKIKSKENILMKKIIIQHL